MKNKIIILFFLTFLSINTIKAQEKANWINSVFWEISGKNIKSSYVFGTHHLYSPEFIQKNPVIMERLHKVDIVVGEMALDSNQFKQMGKMMNAMTLKDKTLKDFLSEKEFQDTDKLMKDLMGIPLAFFTKMKPIVIYQYITIGKYLKSENKEPSSMLGKMPESMDILFQEEGRKSKKEILGLESIEQQMAVLYDGYSLERQVEMLKEIVYDTKKQNKEEKNEVDEVQKLTNMYKSQDINEMEQITQKESTKEEYDNLLKNRNINWIPQITTIIKNKKTAFIAVGAAHLGGKFGVLNLLKKEGYTIKPLTIKIN